ncbi:IK cytokine down-regulator of HLA class II-like protein [Dinothrombium tinctorium]|uniref:IK cytokine down-regulator of HLA class II-like protein n=1 Tax=Dinothrombium tinctorium TaxID=1965070 RepID=A0A443QLV6_9ACAR|nr:IK cytokine down-regulator of HLA class II-like protein [Dinothrombium tinctorium]
MYEKDNEPFSNPIAPLTNEQQKDAAHTAVEHHPLTNDDFRKLLMTPRPSAASVQSSASSTVRSEYPASVRGSRKALLKQETNENKKKKKKFYAAIKKQEEDMLAELAKKYRDRARERRENANPDYQSEDPLASIPSYRAVAPDLKSGVNAAERRKQMIEESKFLGGDMKHTHLVKGLDYALLQKVKAEIEVQEKEKEKEEEEEEMDVETEPLKEPTKKKDAIVEVEEEDQFAIKSVLANNIVKLLFKSKLPEKNDLFLPGRMAYIVDLEDEYADDIPTTVIRSKSDCPNWNSITSLSTNDIVINKLTQILLYLRQGGNKKKKREKIPFMNEETKEKSEKKPDFDDSIYGDIGDYVPPVDRKEKRSKDRRDDDRKEKDRSKERRSHSYFDKPSYEDDSNSLAKTRKEEKESSKTKSALLSTLSTEEVNLRSKLSSKLDVPESYAECYPGAPENDDAILDSDDEVDYSKMDMGNKKGTIGRWDFDTPEEYGEYMSNKEAMPKAAFQYGVKMADGRKTRRIAGKKDEKAKLDRDLQKINALLARRKAEAAESSSAHFKTPRNEPEFKRPKH